MWTQKTSLIVTEKAFDKNPTSIRGEKVFQQTKNRGKFPQLQKSLQLTACLTVKDLTSFPLKSGASQGHPLHQSFLTQYLEDLELNSKLL